MDTKQMNIELMAERIVNRLRLAGNIFLSKCSEPLPDTDLDQVDPELSSALSLEFRDSLLLGVTRRMCVYSINQDRLFAIEITPDGEVITPKPNGPIGEYLRVPPLLYPLLDDNGEPENPVDFLRELISTASWEVDFKPTFLDHVKRSLGKGAFPVW